MEQMGATETWAADSITVTREPDTSLKGVDVDCGKIPDAAMTLAVAALFAEGPTTIRNVYSWRLKETERMKAKTFPTYFEMLESIASHFKSRNEIMR